MVLQKRVAQRLLRRRDGEKQVRVPLAKGTAHARLCEIPAASVLPSVLASFLSSRSE